MKVDRELLEAHNLTEDEYKRIVELLGREPNINELGVFSVMWSEHCSYKSSKVHLKKFPTKGRRVIQGPGENAGVVDIGDGLCVVFKMESHNHPSYIEPFQGAATGVGGILRDIFTMGARPIALLDPLRFGDLSDPKMRYLVRGVVGGISWYGNCVGVPTVGGELHFDESFHRNILVNVMCVGIAEKKRIFYGRAKTVGSPLFYVGAKTGRDGIHGATMASDVFDEEVEKKKPNVQVGDPFTEKLLIEACLEAMEKGLIEGIQDMGAAGLTSSSTEMANRGGRGIMLQLDKVPLREEGMTPYEILLSESQERMLIVGKKGKEMDLIRVFEKWGIDAVKVGEVIKDKRFIVYFKGEKVVDIPVSAVTEDAPLYNRKAKKPKYIDELRKFDPSSLPYLPPEEVIIKMISSAHLSSRKWIYEQYDYMVQINTVIPPGGDAALLRVKGTKKGIAITTDCNSRFCYLDPYMGGVHAVAEAARNLSCVGAEPLAITDCLNFGSPENPEIMWQFIKSVEGIAYAARILRIPIVSGNVSFYNETSGRPVDPSPVIGMVGLLEDIDRRMDCGFRERSKIFCMGRTRGEIGGSLYLKVVYNEKRGKVPRVNLEHERRLGKCLRSLIKKGLILSAHDISEGGLLGALIECSFRYPELRCGFSISLPWKGRIDFLLFGEDPGRVVVSVREDMVSSFVRECKRWKIPVYYLGEVIEGVLEVKGVFNLSFDELFKMWESSLEREVMR